MKRTVFKWKCCHCDRYNSSEWKMEFKMPEYYECINECSHCGVINRLRMMFEVLRGPQ